MITELREYLRVIKDRDPAVRSSWEVVFFYPGFHAIAFHHISNCLYSKRYFLLARGISHLSRFLTGIEIHPGAKIGKNVFIDHGMGVVIGETAEVGDCCLLYQGVVLGGVSDNTGRRHPKLGRNVVVGAGAILLGPISVGDNSRVGAGSVLLKDVESGTTVVGVPAIPTSNKNTSTLEHSKIEDPIARKIEGIEKRLNSLENTIK